MFVFSVENLFASENLLKTLTINGPDSGINNLELNDNDISSILLGPVFVKKINLSNNRLSSIDFFEYSTIEIIDISKNNLKNINKLDLKITKYFNINSNEWGSNLNFSLNRISEDIEEIDLSNNNISSFSMKDLKVLKKLQTLDLSENNLATFNWEEVYYDLPS